MKTVSRVVVIVALLATAIGVRAEESNCVVPLVQHLLVQLPVATVEDVMNLYIALGEALATCGHIDRDEVRERERNLLEIPEAVSTESLGPSVEVNLWLNDYGWLAASLSSSFLIPRFGLSVIVQYKGRSLRFCNTDLIPPDGLAVELGCVGNDFDGFALSDVSGMGVIVGDDRYFSCDQDDSSTWKCMEINS